MKHLHQNQEFRFNEVLFEHRNKEYGAYVLRNESDRILTKALFVGVSLLAAISVTPLIISAFRSEAPPVHVPVDGPPVIVKLKKVDREDTPPLIKPVQPVSPPNVRQYNSIVPTPSNNADDNSKKDPVPDDAVAGVVDNFKGDPIDKNVYVPVAPTIGNGPVSPPRIEPTVEPKDPGNTIVGPEGLSVEANFEGGIDSFRNKVMNKFDTSGFEDTDGVIKTTVTFIVEKDGTISGIKTDGKDVSFNSEAMRVVKLVKGTWKPAKNKQGQNVRSYFRFPISMKFE